MSTLKEKIAVMQAAEDGVEVEFGSNDVGWQSTGVPVWNWSAWDYRIKPQPKEIWVNEHLGGESFVHDTKEVADSYSGQRIVRQSVHYREVTE